MLDEEHREAECGGEVYLSLSACIQLDGKEDETPRLREGVVPGENRSSGLGTAAAGSPQEKVPW